MERVFNQDALCICHQERDHDSMQQALRAMVDHCNEHGIWMRKGGSPKKNKVGEVYRQHFVCHQTPLTAVAEAKAVKRRKNIRNGATLKTQCQYRLTVCKAVPPLIDGKWKLMPVTDTIHRAHDHQPASKRNIAGSDGRSPSTTTALS